MLYKTMTDEELVALSASGDSAAYVELHDRLVPRILGLLIKLLRNRADAEDVLQTVVLEIWSSAQSYDPARASALTWALLMTRSRAIDFLRASSRSARVAGIADLNVDILTNPFHATIRDPAEMGRVANALDALPRDQRVPIDLAFYRGLSRDQIALMLGIPVGTVKTRIRAGVQRLEAALEERSTLSAVDDAA